VADLALGLFAAPEYLQRAGRPAHPADLEHAPHALVGFRAMRARAPLLLAMRRGDETCRVASGGPLAVDDGHAYLAAGIAGLGVVCLPRYLAAGALARGELQPLFEDWHLDPLPLHLAYPPGRQVSRKLRAFIDWVVELLDGRGPDIMRPGRTPARPWKSARPTWPATQRGVDPGG
jgi:DNA-binding transcriptional LysR family regulator